MQEVKTPFIFIDGVTKNYGNINVFNNLYLSVYPNEILCIMGPSGCGKTTLLNLISGNVDITQGNIKREYSKLGYVFQEDRLLPWKTVFENIKFVNEKANDSEIINLINVLGLDGFEQSYPKDLSGGMKQRCSIARAFHYKSDLLIMDEPFKSLDYTLRLQLVKILLNVWNENKNTIIFVTHDIDEALLIGDRIVLFSPRPASIEKIFSIDIDRKYRKLTDVALVSMRQQIVELMVSTTNG